MDVAHARVATVAWEAGLAVFAAAEQDTEELVQMSDQHAIVVISVVLYRVIVNMCSQLIAALVPIARHVLLERSGAAIVQEIGRNAGTAAHVGAEEGTIKVRQQIDLRAVVHARV